MRFREGRGEGEVRDWLGYDGAREGVVGEKRMEGEGMACDVRWRERE